MVSKFVFSMWRIHKDVYKIVIFSTLTLTLIIIITNYALKVKSQSTVIVGEFLT